MVKITDMRSLLKEHDRRGDLVRVRRKVSPAFELAAVLKKVMEATGQAVLFENVNGAVRFAGNLYAGRSKIAVVFGCRPEELTDVFIEKWRARLIPPVKAKTAPCQRHIYRRIKEITEVTSVPQHYGKDAGPYFTAAVAAVKDPETGKYNLSVNRMQLKKGNRLGIQLVINMHIALIQQKYEERGKAMPVAIMVGADPHIMMSASARPPAAVDEYEFSGALKGEPIELTDCLSVPLKVAANAEMVMEGYIPPGLYEEEGPMGEVLQYYGSVLPKQVVDVQTITTRDKPIFQTLLSGSIEEHALLAIPMEAELLPLLKKVAPQVKAINLLPFFLNCVVSVGPIPMTQRGLGKNILLAALTHPWLKTVILVDEDVDIYNADDVMWALATRVDWDKDIVTVKDSHGFPLDEMKADRNATITRIGIDATVDPVHRKRFERRDVVGLERIVLKEYLR